MSEKPLRYVGRYWTWQEIEKAKFRAAAICRWLNKGDPGYQPNVTTRMRVRLTARTLPKKVGSR